MMKNLLKTLFECRQPKTTLEIEKIDASKPIPPLPDYMLWWPGKEQGKVKPGIIWLDNIVLNKFA